MFQKVKQIQLKKKENFGSKLKIKMTLYWSSEFEAFFREVENIRKSFWRLKEEEKGKNFDKKVNSLTRYKIGGLFFFVHFFFANPIRNKPEQC